MKRFVLPLAAAVALSAMSIISAFGEDATVKVGTLEITHAWTRATLPGQPAAAGFLTIENKGGEADHLVSVASPASPEAQLHNMQMENDIMKMAELVDGLEIPAGGKVDLKPGGSHVMFMKLKEGFKEGETVKLTLTFKNAGPVELELPVLPADAKEMAHTYGG